MRQVPAHRREHGQYRSEGSVICFGCSVIDPQRLTVHSLCVGVVLCLCVSCVGVVEDFVPLQVAMSQEDQEALAAGADSFAKHLHNISQPAPSACIKAQLLYSSIFQCNHG